MARISKVIKNDKATQHRRQGGNPFYRRGADFERAFISELSSGEQHLYSVRSAGSHGALDVIELRLPPAPIIVSSAGRTLEVWGYQLKCGEQPRFQWEEIDYLSFLEDMGINVRIVWKPIVKAKKGPRKGRYSRQPRRMFTVAEARRWFTVAKDQKTSPPQQSSPQP